MTRCSRCSLVWGWACARGRGAEGGPRRQPSPFLFFMFPGLFLGPRPAFLAALEPTGTACPTPLRRALVAHATETTYLQCVLDLTGWNTTTLDSLVADWSWKRAYYKYKSALFVEALPDAALTQLLQLSATTMREASPDMVVFEFQALGGEGSAFSRVPPLSTAFAHRRAQTALILRSIGHTLPEAHAMEAIMERAYGAVMSLVPGAAAYVNFLDTALWDYQDRFYGTDTVRLGRLAAARKVPVSCARDPS